MIYRLKELQGDTIAVPQLVFSKLGIAEEYNVRVALYVLATGITDPDTVSYTHLDVYKRQIQPGAPGGLLHLLAALGFFDPLELGRKVQIFLHGHFRVQRRLLRQVAHTGFEMCIRDRVMISGLTTGM